MIAREDAKKKIEKLLKSKRSEFLAVTGRRRIGKTFLIDELLGKYFCFSLTGIQNGSHSTQITNFVIKLNKYYATSKDNNFNNWQMVFADFKTYLQALTKRKKQVIFIDELPWIATAKSGFLQLLAHLWNDYLSKEKHFILVICGSATSWIINKVINDKGGLHNRVTEQIHLKPFSLAETQLFFKSKKIRFSPQQLAKIYMALGGVPFYLEKIEKGESFQVAIERLCFNENGALYNEYQNLYHALFNNASLHQKIIKVLSKTGKGLNRNDLALKLKLKLSGSFQRAIDELLISNFIQEQATFGKKKRETVLTVCDEFSRFYHKFMEGNKRYSKGMWHQIAASQSYKSWLGFAFESLCFKNIDKLKSALGIESVYTEISQLSVASTKTHRGFQIDLIIDRKDDTINLCEIKFYDGQFTINKSYYKQLVDRRSLFNDYSQTKKQIFMTFISIFGLAENEYYLDLVDNQIVIEQFFK